MRTLSILCLGILLASAAASARDDVSASPNEVMEFRAVPAKRAPAAVNAPASSGEKITLNELPEQTEAAFCIHCAIESQTRGEPLPAQAKKILEATLRNK
jgi:hypothetical protein